MSEEKPEVGETWVIEGLAQHGPIYNSGAQGNLSDFYSHWKQVEGKEVRILDDKRHFKVQLVESIIGPAYPDGIWTVVSRCYLGKRVKDNLGRKPWSRPKDCCSPSRGGVCAACKDEFHKSQEAKGLRLNRWTKLWEKAR